MYCIGSLGACDYTVHVHVAHNYAHRSTPRHSGVLRAIRGVAGGTLVRAIRGVLVSFIPTARVHCAECHQGSGPGCCQGPPWKVDPDAAAQGT